MLILNVSHTLDFPDAPSLPSSLPDLFAACS